MGAKAALLKSVFPVGTRQCARRPCGAPGKYFPPVFEHGKCVFGHPAASRVTSSSFTAKGCVAPRASLLSDLHLLYSKSLTATSASHQVVSAATTDDCVFAAPFE